MNKKTFTLLVLLTTLNTAFAQKNQSGERNPDFISMDSASDIRINKVIFYASPLEFNYYVIEDTSYLPVWYKTFCVIFNSMSYIDKAKEAIRYYSPEHRNYTEEEWIKTTEDFNKSGGVKSRLEMYGYPGLMYIFSEIWFNKISNGNTYVLLQGYNSKNKFKDLKLSTNIIAKNPQKMEFDTIRNRSVSVTILKLENDTLRWIDQMKTSEIIGGMPGPYLYYLKDLCYRRSEYVVSEIENGKRVFKTMGKDNHGKHRMIRSAFKPEE